MIDDVGWVTSFLGRHRIDNAKESVHVVIEISTGEHILHASHAGDHAEYFSKRAEPSCLKEHCLKIFEREFSCSQALFLLLHFILIKFFLRLFNERKHVAHSENSTSHSIGMKILKCVYLLTSPDKFDWHTSHALD